MARIQQTELDRLKQEVSVQQLAEARGIKLQGHGDNLLGLCPFHNDTSPSLVINPTKNLWNCLGACNKGGSVIDWVMEAEGVSFRHAVEILRARSPSSPIADAGAQLDTTTGCDDATLLSRVIDYYHQRLKQSPDAQAYLQRRGLGDSEMLAAFRVGSFRPSRMGWSIGRAMSKSSAATNRLMTLARASPRRPFL